MSSHDVARRLTAAEVLAQWREAERLAAVARRGKSAAQAASLAAEDAVAAARETAAAAWSALKYAHEADASARRTAESARLAMVAADADLADMTLESERADGDETAARERYQDAVDEAERRQPS